MKFNRVSQKLKRKLNDSKGMALLATLIFTFVISTLGIALLTMTNNDTKLTTLQKESSEAFYLADSGINRAINWLEVEGQASPPGQNVINLNVILNGTKWIDSEGNEYPEDANLSPGKYYKIEMTLETGIDSNREYKIISTGKLIGPRNATRVIEQLVDVTNFAEYAYFSMDEGDTIWFYGEDIIDGRLHTNGQLRIKDSPTFKGLVTSATEPIIWYNNKEHFEVFDENGYRLGADEYIPLPEKTEDISGTDNPYSLESIAMGSWTEADLPSENGVYIPNDGYDNSTGGIYVEGNLEGLSLTTENGLSKIIFERPYYSHHHWTTITTTITSLPAGSEDPYNVGVSYLNDRTIIKEGTAAPDYYNKLTNGLLYVNGEIESLEAPASEGGHQGKLTIVATEDITITNDIKYNSLIENSYIDIHTDNPDELSQINDTLGIISSDDIVLKIGNSNPIVCATIMALGESMYNYYNSRTPPGIFTLFGGLIQVKRGIMGHHSSNNVQTSGYAKDYNFDDRMNDPTLDALPPYFPTTGNYEPIYWMESNG
jgi:hypothetical protein